MNWTAPRLALFLACLSVSNQLLALTGVNPSGVNVRSSGATTVFLTFQNTGGQRAVDGFWCGDITVPSNTPTATNPCVPGTLFGNLPSRNDLSRGSGTGDRNNITDIMTIPPSVARRAYLAAINGESSEFFYVRRFVDGNGASQYIAVTCRMAGGGARVPLALTEVRLAFVTDDANSAVVVLAKDSVAPPLLARIRYNGSGRLKGRWEVVRPGDLEPEFEDLLTEASLPVELRGSQRRYTLLGRFDVFLPPSGEATVPVPDPSLLPTYSEGPYKILFRVEASAETEGNSNTLEGIAISGGVAGFPMPVVRYVVTAAGASGDGVEGGNTPGTLTLLSPRNDARVVSGEPVTFSWTPLPEADLQELEIKSGDRTVLTALVEAGRAEYALLPWIQISQDELWRWRIAALDKNGNKITISTWRLMQGL